jgi:hypothetical protein
MMIMETLAVPQSTVLVQDSGRNLRRRQIKLIGVEAVNNCLLVKPKYTHAWVVI